MDLRNLSRLAHIGCMVTTLFAIAAHAETLTGRVVGISDGDTITVLIGREQVKVRLADIDAPESRQAFGTRSKQALSDLCYNKDSRLETQGKDRYGRTIATVHCAGGNANADQVWQGMAWVFDRYARPDSPLYILQKQAKATHRGLWSDPNPYRRGNGGDVNGTGMQSRRLRAGVALRCRCSRNQRRGSGCVIGKRARTRP